VTTREAGTTIGLTAAVSFLVGLVAAGTRPPGPTTPMPVRPAPTMSGSASTGSGAIAAPASSPLAGPASTGIDFASVAARVNAAVVNVDAAARGTSQRWRRDMGDDPNAPREGSGSGFIIDKSGLILTNYHVVEGADRITVTLGDGRSFKATVTGVDPAIDVAVLRIPAQGSLPVATLGNSDSLRVGEWVCAIGNPLGYVHSVTVGVVSFLGRKLFDQSLDAFIQTDAAISFGNSGGPLINAQGQVVGITTAVSAQASNIGFAIPISQVVSVLPQLEETGRVTRGYIGVGLTDLTPALHRALGIEPERGALVQDVSPDTPAERAGLRAYDVITRADDVAIHSDEDLIRHISGRSPGSLAALEVWRDGHSRQISLKLTERPLAETVRTRTNRLQSVHPVSGREQGPLGMTVRDLDRAAAQRQGIPETIDGVIVMDVDPAGPARLARIRAGHVVLEVNRKRVTTASEFQAIVNTLKPGEAAVVLVYDKISDQRLITAIVADPPS
jgi:serine protease Do